MAEHAHSTICAAATVPDKAAQAVRYTPPAPDHQREMDPPPTANSDPTTTIQRRTLPAFVAAFLLARGTPAALAQEPDRPPPVFATNPDAALIALADDHIRNLAASNASPVPDYEDDPTWYAYERTREAISAAQPVTLAGMAAKARAAKAEANQPLGESPEGTVAESWSWDLVNDLLRLAGRDA